MSPIRPTKNGKRGTRHAPPTNAFKKGNKGGPGRAAVPPEMRELLASDAPEHYRKAIELTDKAEAAGDLKTALHGRLSLLKKSVPDATELVVSIPEGLEVRDRRINLAKLTTEEAQAFAVLVAKATKGDA